MNRKMQCFALVAKCAPPATSAALAALPKNPCRDSRSTSASDANPPPTSHKKPRRERPHGVGLGISRRQEWDDISFHSIGISEFIEVQDHTAYLHQRRMLGARGHFSFIERTDS